METIGGKYIVGHCPSCGGPILMKNEENAKIEYSCECRNNLKPEVYPLPFGYPVPYYPPYIGPYYITKWTTSSPLPDTICKTTGGDSH